MLDPHTQGLLNFINSQPTPSPASVPLETLRASMVVPQAEVEAVASVTEQMISGGDDQPMRLRIYRPESATEPPLPAIVYLHGGGFVLCSLDTHDNICRALCNSAGAVVVSVDYRLAPEQPFPAAPEDGYQALLWLYQQAAELGIDAQAITVAGDSAGANLAAVLCLLSRDRNGPVINKQLLLYPALDARCNSPSMAEFAEGYLLSREQMRWFWQQYLPPSQQHSPYAQPRLADLSGLPPAIVITAEYDPLRDEGAAFAEALMQAGNQVDYQCAGGQIHGFCSYMDALPEARRTLGLLAASL
ncbi:alpha/beta hydrolase [Spongiibacter sp.]|uniref:alpha/beta hydrolase n=1 Tax=Spongiibacter sp. TaxID=2024860 RepID=UPI00356454C4